MNIKGIRKLLEAAELAPVVRADIAKLIIKLCEEAACEIYLTVEEQYEGQNRNKLECVKLYKARTGKGLMESKKDCEKYFEANGLKFFSHSY